jgi:hypothetical protein
MLYGCRMSSPGTSSSFARALGHLAQPRSRCLVAEVALFVFAIWAHVALIAKLPKGLYIDELSIGYNAFLIATHGHDEFGVRWPLYFKAFGEYKNPLYVYLMSLVFKLLGYSVWTTRFTSFLCWFLGTCGFYALGRRLWQDGIVRAFLLLSLSFTPWIFALSRVCFELIVLYPVLGLYLYATYRGFEDRSRVWAAIAGAALGLSVYAYTTFRLLAPLHVLATVLCYFERKYWRQALIFAASAAVVAIPFAVYLITDQANLTGRFQGISYLGKDTLSWADKGLLFGERYLGYFELEFLTQHGDSNRRHHAGGGGQLFIATVAAAIVALIAHFDARTLWRDRFLRLLVFGALLSPVAAALTEDRQHSLRSLSLAFYAILISAYGVQWLRGRHSRIWSTVVVLVLAVNSFSYLRHYVTTFPDESIAAFNSYGFFEAFKRATKAARASHGRVVVTKDSPYPESVPAYYAPMMGDPKPSFVMGEREDMKRGDVLVFRDPDKKFPELHVGVPKKSIYAWQRYAQRDMKPRD